MAYLRKMGDVQPAVEGRIQVKAAAEVTASAPEQAQAPAAPQPNVNVYIVRPGDSLWAIARMYQTTWQTLHKLNPIPNPNLIFPGQQIVLP